MMGGILAALLPAFLPVVTDGVRGVFNKFTGGAAAAPANVAEVKTLMEAETERLTALSKIDNADGVSQWVSNIRALQRPAASLLIISTYAAVILSKQQPDIIHGVGQYAQMVTFYLFGDRTYSYFKRG